MKYLMPFLLAFALPLLAEHYHVNPSPMVPAATGDLNVGKDSNGNATLDLKVEHLAKPGELAPSRQVYVVWIEAPGSDPKNAGELRVGGDLKGQLKTVTSARSFDLVVTAEDSTAAQEPHGEVVLRA